MTGRTFCHECATYHAERRVAQRKIPEKREAMIASQKKLRENRKAAGFCPNCGKLANSGYVLCDSCRSKRRNYMAKYNNHQPRGEYGICWTCNKREAVPGKRLCAECAEKAKRNLIPGPKGFTGDISAVLFVKKRKEEAWNG